MSPKKISSRMYTLAKSVAAAAVLPAFFIYIMVAKPDYRIMNMASHVVVPVARGVGDVVTWPVRVGGRMVRGVRDLAVLRRENAELRAELVALRWRARDCDAMSSENQKLARELDLVQSAPRRSIAANVVHDASALHHNTFFVSKGSRHGIEPGMIAVTFDGMMVGIVIDAAPGFSRVRALNDANTNIAVRIVGSEVYGFLRGTGASNPQMGFFSDPEFQPTPGVKLVTSGIGGVLPDGVAVGEMINDTDVRIAAPGGVSRVMIMQFDDNGGYK